MKHAASLKGGMMLRGVCPNEVRSAVCAILRDALLRIRVARPERVPIEADHVHNLPGLLDDFRPELLDYYIEVEREIFFERTLAGDAAVFAEPWERLDAYARTSPTSA